MELFLNLQTRSGMYWHSHLGTAWWKINVPVFKLCKSICRQQVSTERHEFDMLWQQMMS